MSELQPLYEDDFGQKVDRTTVTRYLVVDSVGNILKVHEKLTDARAHLNSIPIERLRGIVVCRHYIAKRVYETTSITTLTRTEFQKEKNK